MTNTQLSLLSDIILDVDNRNNFYNLAQEIFGTDQEIELWLVTPNVFLDSLRPLDLIKDIDGVDRVMTYLQKIESGTYV